MKFKICITALFYSAALNAGIIDTSDQWFAVKEIAVMQQNSSGKYDVVCTNGNRETVTDLDLELGNVCPNRTSTKPSGILSIQRMENNKFSVVCRDLKRIEATDEEIISGKACAHSIPKNQIEDGEYTVSSGTDFCPQGLKAKHDGATVVEVMLKFLSPCSGQTVALKCDGAVCKGSLSSNSYSLEVLSPIEYRFTRISSGDSAIFKKK